jgi:hypothetical protein
MFNSFFLLLSDVFVSFAHITRPTQQEWVGFCLGSMSAGAVPAALPTTSTTPEIARMLAIAQVRQIGVRLVL